MHSVAALFFFLSETCHFCVVLHVYLHYLTCTHARTHTFNGPFSRTTQVSQNQKGKTNLDFTEARDSELHQ